MTGKVSEHSKPRGSATPPGESIAFSFLSTLSNTVFVSFFSTELPYGAVKGSHFFREQCTHLNSQSVSPSVVILMN